MYLTSEFASGLRELFSSSRALAGMFTHADIILNPAAGFFTRIRRYQDRIQNLFHFIEQHRKEHGAARPLSHTLHLTEYAGHAGSLARQIAGQALRAGEGLRLLVTAGGDGTHQSVCSALLDADRAVRERLFVLRLPMGTGNDGADAGDLDDLCDIARGRYSCGRASALELRPSGCAPLHSFNIASVGLDAYVVLMTNRLKRFVPGTFYRAMADLASVVYEPLCGVRPMRVEISDGRDAGTVLEDRFLFLAAGVSGSRTYGDHIRILPDEENVCLVRNTGLFRKLAIKGRFYRGEHRGLPEVTLLGASGMRIDFEGRLPVQLDGEALWLEPEHSPLELRVLPPMLNVLKAGQGGCGDVERSAPVISLQH